MERLGLTRRRFFAGGAASVAMLAMPAAAFAKSDVEIDTAALAMDELHGDADTLLKLTLDFHARLEDLDPATTLPLALVNEARKIEKAARAIQDRLKGVP